MFSRSLFIFISKLDSLGIELVTHQSLVRATAAVLSSNNLGQVVHTNVPLSSSSITWYRQKLGRKQHYDSLAHDSRGSNSR